MEVSNGDYARKQLGLYVDKFRTNCKYNSKYYLTDNSNGNSLMMKWWLSITSTVLSVSHEFLMAFPESGKDNVQKYNVLR